MNVQYIHFEANNNGMIANFIAYSVCMTDRFIAQMHDDYN